VLNAVQAGVKPTAAFTATPRDVCAISDVNFTDQSTGNPTSWLWFFGDGGVSNDQNPIYQYQDTGYFNVTLIVSNFGCADTLRLDNYIHVKPPIARFKDSLTCGNPYIRFFTDQSVAPLTWFWEFGDGTTDTIPSPTHTYTNKGNYTVRLTVTNGACTHSTTLPVNIIEEKAAFTASDTVVCKGASVGFVTNNINVANITSFQWHFGDGATGGGATPAHVYTRAGIYTVKLVITDRNGCKDSLTKPLHITVFGPTANFASVTPGACLNAAVSFADSSRSDGTHPIQQWIWNYGDGSSDTLTAPPFQHLYAAQGTYTVSLTVTDSRGCRDIITKNSYLVVARPQAIFYTPDTNSCPLRPVRFISQSQGISLGFIWDFGDGTTSTLTHPVHAYANEGIYTVKLIVYDRYGCRDSVSKISYVTVLKPRAVFSLSDSVSTCPPLVVNFTNQSINFASYSWDFGDGTFSNVANPSHFYNAPGVYYAKLYITGPAGCRDSMTKTITVRGPQGSFRYDRLAGCTPLTVGFTAVTRDNVSFVWDFNDGTVNAVPDAQVSHTFTTPGVYLPKVILVDASGCQIPIVGRDTIRVYGVDAKFGMSKTLLCDSGRVAFTDSTTSNDIITSHQWSFGDGAVSAQLNPVHGYNTSGNYPIQLIVTTQNGCRDTAVSNIPLRIVKSPDIAISGGLNACAPASTTFAGQLQQPDTSAIDWSWNFGNGQTGSGQYPAAQLYNNPGSYAVQLIAVNSSGCRDTAAQSLQVHPKPVVDAGLDTLVCKGSSITLNATGAATYSWSPANFLSCSNCASPAASPDTAMWFRVRGASQFNCTADDSVYVRVKFPFTMRVGPGDTLCDGESARLTASGADMYQWVPALNVQNPASNNTVATPRTSTTYLVIGRDDRNCFRDTGRVRIDVYPIPTVEAGQDKTIAVGSSVQLNAAISPDVTDIKWIPSNGLSCNNCPNPVARPTTDATYTIRVRNPGGCSSSDQLRILVTCDGGNLYMPNTFSPNRDGANDVFFPRGRGIHGIRALRVFNRWGEVVFERMNFAANDASSGWDGTYKGMPASPDVYVYTIEIICQNNTTLSFKGNIALVR
jgi:gliding motility-associated-like protein